MGCALNRGGAGGAQELRHLGRKNPQALKPQALPRTTNDQSGFRLCGSGSNIFEARCYHEPVRPESPNPSLRTPILRPSILDKESLKVHVWVFMF